MSQSLFSTSTNPTSSGFRFNSKSVFLTYPHSNFSKEELRDFLSSICPLRKYVICIEKHGDGDTHLHACVVFARKLDSRNVTFFDFNGRHPNIGSIRSWNAAATYCKKDGDFLEGEDPSDRQPRRDADDYYTEALRTSTSTEEFLTTMERLRPRDAVLYHNQLVRYAAYKWPVKTRAYKPAYHALPFSNVPPLAKEWANRYLENPVEGRPKSLCLVGPSRIGKTAWARSLGPHIYISGYYSLDELKGEGKYIVCDDIPWDRFPNYKAIVGCQEEFILTDKYRGKVPFRDWHKPCIILWNEDMYPTFTRDQALWWNDNVRVITCTEPFYQNE